MRSRCFPTILVLAFAFPAAAADWYVGPGGNDDTGTGSQNNPWRTVEYAVDQAGSGDSVLLLDDNDPATWDYQENVEVGADRTNLTIAAAEDDDSPPGFAVGDGADQALLIHATGVVVSGLDFGGPDQTRGIVLELPATDGVVQNCSFSNTELGKLIRGIEVQQGSTGHAVVDCRFAGLSYGIYANWEEKAAPGLKVEQSQFVDNVSAVDLTNVDENTFFDNEFAGMGSHGIYLWTCDDNVVEDNTFDSMSQDRSTPSPWRSTRPVRERSKERASRARGTAPKCSTKGPWWWWRLLRRETPTSWVATAAMG